jgi:hypothetical protein
VQNGPRRPYSARQPRPAGSYSGRSRGPTSNTPRTPQTGSQGAQRGYERYMELARAEVVAGNTVGAENYYQHAEHYFRTMNAGPEEPSDVARAPG